jgi:hypothetical protein
LRSLGTFFIALQIPELWVTYAQLLASAMAGDGAPIMRMIARRYSDPDPPPDKEGYIETEQWELWRLAISCGDARPYGKGEKWPTAEEIVDRILGTMEESPRFGAT